MSIKNTLLLCVALLSLLSCNSYQKALKSEDISVKFEEATKQYNKQKYVKAIRLMEQIAPSYRGKPQSEQLFYMLGKSYFNTHQYLLSAFEFERFTSNFSKSEKLEEVAYLGAKSYYYDSPVYSLEQTSTDKAINKLQIFINTYPKSEYINEANGIVKELREKLEFKAFEIARQYNTISDFKASLIALDNFISDYPGTPYKEAALYYKLDSAYKLAINSVPSKMEERLKNAKNVYTTLIKFKPDTTYKKQADNMLASIDKELQKFSK